MPTPEATCLFGAEYGISPGLIMALSPVQKGVSIWSCRQIFLAVPDFVRSILLLPQEALSHTVPGSDTHPISLN
jgi:hypothetical protein